MLPLPNIQGLIKSYSPEEAMPNRHARTLKTMAALCLAKEKRAPGFRLPESMTEAIALLGKDLTPKSNTENVFVSGHSDEGWPFQVWIEPQYYCQMPLFWLDDYQARDPQGYAVIREVIAGLIYRCPSITTVDTYDYGAADWLDMMAADAAQGEEEGVSHARTDAEDELAWFQKHFPKHSPKRQPAWGTPQWCGLNVGRVTALRLARKQEKWLLGAIHATGYWAAFSLQPPFLRREEIFEDRPSFTETFCFIHRWGSWLSEEQEGRTQEYWNNDGPPLVVAEPRTEEDFEKIDIFIKELDALQQLFVEGEIWSRKKPAARQVKH